MHTLPLLRRFSLLAGLALVSSLAPRLALAAPEPAVPAGTASQDNASSGSTELGTGDTFTTTAEVAAEGEVDPDAPTGPHANDATEFDIALGGIFNTGNSKSLAATGLTNFRLRRSIHQFTAQAAGNYGAGGNDNDKYDTNVANVQGLVRYDVFFAKRWTAFVQSTARHDTFQGLTYRMNVDPGFAVYAINKPTHRLWFEAGYDFQYDLRTLDSRWLLDADGNPIPSPADATINEIDPAITKTFVNHAVRLYAGYSNKLSEKVSFDTGLEYLQSVIEADRLRLNYLAAINTQLVDRLSLAVTFTLRYDNKPVNETILKLDTITAVSLAYRFF